MKRPSGALEDPFVQVWDLTVFLESFQGCPRVVLQAQKGQLYTKRPKGAQWDYVATTRGEPLSEALVFVTKALDELWEPGL